MNDYKADLDKTDAGSARRQRRSDTNMSANANDDCRKSREQMLTDYTRLQTQA